MKLIDNIYKITKSFYRRRKLSITNQTTNKEEWSTHVSPAGIVTLVATTLISLIATMLLLAGYTSILNIFPEYKTQSERSRISLMESVERVDNIEKQLTSMLEYNRNIALIMDGKSPITRNTTKPTNDTKESGARITRSNLDSLLRDQMTQSDRYNLNYEAYNRVEKIRSASNFSTPIEGIITQSFDIANNLYGVKIASQTKSPIYATDSGIILKSLWSPDFGHSVEIIHYGGAISIYKNLSESFVRKGDAVKSGEAIGYSSISLRDGAAAKIFEYELWIDGKPVNPEYYINF